MLLLVYYPIFRIINPNNEEHSMQKAYGIKIGSENFQERVDTVLDELASDGLQANYAVMELRNSAERVILLGSHLVI